MEPKQLGTGGERASSGNEPGGGWAFPALLAAVLLVVAGVAQLRPKGEPQKAGNSPAAIEWSPTAEPQGETVGLTIDFGNGAKQQFEALPWRAGLTVEMLLQEAVKYRPGIHFTQQGEGEAGFLQSIEGLKNQGESGRNWMYEVNDRFAEMSFCLQKLEPGDRVLWKFAGRE